MNSQGIQGRKTYRSIDVERANEMYRRTGRIGEELIFKYLDNLKHKSKIVDFSWMNQSRESGLPYDFKIIQNDNESRLIDVKTTRYKFDSPLVFSSQEISFVSNEPVLYSVYRTYSIANEEPKLRICDNSKAKMRIVNEDYSKFSAICKSHGYRAQSSFLVYPSDPMLTFFPEIIL